MADQNVGRLVASFELDATKFKQELASSKEALQQIPIASARADASLRSHAQSWETVATSSGKAKTELKDGEDQINRVGKAAQAHASSFDQISKSIVGVVATTITFNAALRLTEDVIGGIGKQINDARTAARDFETSWTGVTKTVDASAADLSNMSNELRRMAREELPISIDNLNKLAETGGALGVHAENITEFTSVMAKLGVTTNIVGEAGATMVARFANIAHVDQKDFDRIASAIVGLGNDGASTEQDILAMGLRLAGAADTAGVSAPKILGLANALSSVGVEAEAGGTSVSKALSDMSSAASGEGAKATLALQNFALVGGRSIEDMRKKIKTDAVGAFEDVVEGISQIKNRGGDVFGVLTTLGFQDSRERDTILRLASNVGELNRQIEDGQKLYDENNALQDEFAKRAETSASKAQLAENAFHDLQITLGGPLNKAMGELAIGFMDNANNSGSLAEKLSGELTPQIENVVAAIIPLMKQFTEELPGAIATTKKELQDTITLFGAFGSTIDKINNFGPKVTGGENSIPSPGQAGIAVRNAIIGAANGNPDFTDKGYPKNGQAPAGTPTSANTVVSGGMVVLQAEAEANLAAATEAYNTWRETQDKVAQAQQVADQVDTQAASVGTSRGTAVEPETKEARAARLKAEADAAREAERARKAAAAEAKREAERAAREAARLAEQHAELISQFQRVSTEGTGAQTPEVGKLAAQVNQALSAAFEPHASGSAGSALAKAVSDLINQAEKVGIPNARESGERIKAAMLQAISTKSESDREAAQALANNLGEQIAAQSRLTPENFARSFEQSINRNTIGSDGASLLEGLKKSATEGTPQALDQATDALARLQGQLFGNQNLTPEQVQAYWARIMDAVTVTIEQGGEEARATLEQTLREINVEQLLDVAGNVVNDRFKNASETASRQIQQATETANRSISEAISQLEQANANREQRANITRTQIEELKGPTRDIETARINRQNLRSDQAEAQARMKQGADMERDYQRQLIDIRRQASGTYDGVGSASVGSQERLARARAEGLNVGPVDNTLQKQLAEAKRVHEQKLLDVKAQQDYEDNLKLLNRATAAADRRQDEEWAQTLTDFKNRQADNVLAYEDAQAQIALHHKIDPGGTIDKELGARKQAITDAYTEQETRAIDQFNKDLARQLILRNVAPGGAGESATREQLTGQFNSYRAMLGLPALEGTPFSGGTYRPAGPPMGTMSSFTPSQAVDDALNGGATGDPRYRTGEEAVATREGGEGNGIIINNDFRGAYITDEQRLADAVEQRILRSTNTTRNIQGPQR